MMDEEKEEEQDDGGAKPETESRKTPRRGLAILSRVILAVTALGVIPLALATFGGIALIIGLSFQPNRTPIKPVPRSTLFVNSNYPIKSITLLFRFPDNGASASVETQIYTATENPVPVTIFWAITAPRPSGANAEPEAHAQTQAQAHEAGDPVLRNVYAHYGGLAGVDDIQGTMDTNNIVGTVIDITSSQFIENNGVQFEQSFPAVVFETKAAGSPTVTIQDAGPELGGFLWADSTSAPDSEGVYMQWTRETLPNGEFISASNPTAMANDQTAATIAGVFYGVAGGGFASAFQEGLKALSEKREKRRKPASESLRGSAQRASAL
jgi:hypothetical protein